MSYTAREWQAGDVILASEMGQLSSAVAEHDQILRDYRDWSTVLADLNATIDSRLSTLNNYVTIANIYGEAVDNGNFDNLKAWIQSELNAQQSSIDELISSNRTLSTSIGTNTTRINELYNEIYGANAGQNQDSLVTRIEKALGISLNSADNPAITIEQKATSLYTLIQQIQNELGLSDNEQSETSLLSKIEIALGRPIAPTAAQQQADSNLAKSLYTLINEVRSVLGMEGASSSAQTSTLIDDVDAMLNMLYGYSTINNEIVRNVAPTFPSSITYPYITLYNDFYNGTNGSLPTLISGLQTSVGEITSSTQTLNTKVNNYDSIIQNLSSAYRAADIKTYGENTYLILKSDLEELDATTENEIENKTNEYVLLPKMGGGGGTSYELEAAFTNRQLPASNSISIGDTYNITFTWAVTQEQSNVPIDGNLTIKLNGATVDTIMILSNTPYTFDLGQYISTSGRNVFTLVATNAATPTRTLYTTVIAYNAVLTSTFNPSIVQTGSTIEYTYTASIGSSSIEKILHIIIDGIEVQQNSSISETIRSVFFSTPAAGDHLIETYFTANVGTTANPIIITSNVLAYGIICGASNQTRIATSFNQSTVQQYDILHIDYLVITPNQEETDVYFYIGGSSTPIVERVNTTYQRLDYPVTQSAGTLTIRIVAGSAEKILQTTVISNQNYDFSMVSTGLQAYYNGMQKTNASPTRTKWENSVADTANNEYKVEGTLKDFLFYNVNNFDGWLRDENGQSFLRLRNKAKATIKLPIFNLNIDANNKITDGMTFEVDFKTSDVTNYNTEIISCYEEGKKNDRNIIFTAQTASIKNSSMITTQFKEEERLTIAFVIENSSKGEVYQLLKIYINGILSAVTEYNSTNLNYSDLSKAIIELGSEECTLDIYSIRFYNRPLAFNEIIQNWIFDTGSYAEKIVRYNRNNYRDSQGRITYNSFRAASPNTPYMVITGNGDWNNDDGNTAMPTTKNDGTYETATKGIIVTYTDPNNSANSFTTDFNGGSVGVAIQGTSSQEYMRKNYKIKLSVFQQDGIIHVKKPAKSVNKDDYYVEEYDENENRVYNTLKSGYSASGYKLSANSLDTFTFCIKADVASSESANNVILVGLYDELIRDVGLTPPQGDNEHVRQGIEGYPMVVWYYNTVTQEYTFLGKYNFNNDKGTEDVYGFIQGDESWEVGNNEKMLCFFDESEDPDWTNWRTAFETRYPDDDDSLVKKIKEGVVPYTDEQIANRLAGLRQMVHWVSHRTDWVDSTTKEEIQFVYTPEEIAALNVTTAAEAFKKEFENYFHVDFMTFFYVFTEFFLMVDNRAKNMFLTRYKVGANRPVSAIWHENNDSKTVQLASSTSTTDSYSGWFSLPYDMDTAIGTNNVGVYKFDYHYETGDYQPDGSVVFNGQKSKLWVAFKQVFGNEIDNMYVRFKNSTSYETLEQKFEQHQGVWSETIVNEDMEGKYIDWLTSPTARDSRALPMALGLKSEQRKSWLYNRFKYLNSKLALDAARDYISLGVRTGQLDIPVSVYADSYVTFKVGAQDSAPTTIRVGLGETKTIHRIAANTTGQGDRVESSLSPASRIKSVENLASLELNNADFSQAIRLQTLRIGSPTQINTRLNSISLAGNKLLRLFDLRNCSGYSNDLSLSNCLSLEKLYLSGTNIENVILPNGGILATVQYPTSITTINIKNQPYLTNLIIGNALPIDEKTDADITANIPTFYEANNDYSGITSITLDNVGEIVDVAAIVMGATNLADCSLSNVTFHMSAIEFKALFDKLNAMNNTLANSAKINNCVLYLSSGLASVGLTVNDITEKYDIKVYDENGNEYFNIKFYDLENNFMSGYTQSVTNNSIASIEAVNTYFTPEIDYAYNNLPYINGEYIINNDVQTIQGFVGWDYDFTNPITTDLDVHAVVGTKYRLNYHYMSDFTTPAVEPRFYSEGAEIINIQNQLTNATFIYDYYRYRIYMWTLNSEQPEEYPNGTDNRTIVPEINMYKQPNTEDWYAVYTHDPATYTIKIYNTDINSEITSELGSFNRTARDNNGNIVLITENDLAPYVPSNDNNIRLIDTTYNVDESNIPIESCEYQFLGWSPKTTVLGIPVKPDENGIMTFKLIYYKIDDPYSNYFLNKLTSCELSEDVTSLPYGSFMNNTELERLTTFAEDIGAYSFSSFNQSAKTRYIIFKGENLHLGAFCFYKLNASAPPSETERGTTYIIIEASGEVTVDRNVFYQIGSNCFIILPNLTTTIKPIVSNSTINSSSFREFYTNDDSRLIYVKNQAVADLYNNELFQGRLVNAVRVIDSSIEAILNEVT